MRTAAVGRTIGFSAPERASLRACQMPAGADDFAALVERAIRGTLLRYSERLRLLKEAQRRGIGRFEANLIIAAVVHRTGAGQEVELAPERSGWRGLVLTAALTQAAIVAGAWWMLSL